MADEEKTEAEKAPAVAEATTAVAEGSAPEATAEASTDADSKVKIKKSKKRADVNGRCAVKATFNNTIITISDNNGNVISWGSAGRAGIKGSRKSTPFAAQLAGEIAAKKALEMGMRRLDVVVKGAGPGRESAVRSLKNAGMEVLSIKDLTGIPHNGCRPKKKRRV